MDVEQGRGRIESRRGGSGKGRLRSFRRPKAVTINTRGVALLNDFNFQRLPKGPMPIFALAFHAQ